MSVTSCGLLHSEICGSMSVCDSPQLIAAYHVLLRLPVPRHSPCALCSLTMCNLWFSNVIKFFTLWLLIRICSLNYPTEKLSLMNHFLSLLVFLTSISQLFLFNFQCSLLLSKLVGTSGLEPPTSRLSGVRSNHLSYAPIFDQIGSSYIFIPLVEMRRIELLTPCVQGRCSPS